MPNVNYPSMCVDNFYDDPDYVRNFALSQEFLADMKGRHPGLRTNAISELDPNLFRHFSERLMSLFFDLSNPITWNIQTHFQIIYPYDSNKDSPKNRGWIHIDVEGRGNFNGVIYLTPSINGDSGTSLFELKSNLHNYIEDKRAFYSNGTDNDYDEKMIKHESCFEETVRFQNKYNRLVCFDADSWHRANGFFSDGMPRLFQIFFVRNIETSVASPCQRMRSFKL